MMSDQFIPKNDNILLGAALFSSAMLLIPGLDAIAKYLAQDMSPLYVSWARYLAAAIMIIPFSFRKFGTGIFPKRNLKSHFMRTFFIIVAMLFFFISLSTTPLATASAVTMIAPIVATMAAVYLLGERFTWPKLAALVMGFIGAMIIINPTVEIQIGTIFAALTGIFYGMYIVTTRMTAKQSDPLKTLTFQCVVGALMLTPLALYAWDTPTQTEFLLILAMGVVSLTAHGLTLLAFQYAQTSTLSPLVYLEVVSAVFLGYVIFADIPTLGFWIGAAFIIIGGLSATMGRAKSKPLR